MISLLEIAKSIDEAEMKLKPKGGGKVVVFKNKDNYEDALKSGDYEEPEGSKKVKSKDSDMDFGRDGGDSEKVDGPSPEDDWDNEQVMTAKIGGEEVGDIIDNPNHPNYDKAMDYVMSFDPDDEKLVTGPGSDDNAESDDIEISDANSGPIDRDDIMDMLKNDSEVVDKMGDDVYWDGVDLVSSKFDDDTIASVDGNMTLGDLKKQIMDYEEMSETININLKEKYDRIFRSLK